MSRTSSRRKKRQPESHFDPTITRGIFAVILLIASILITLSFFGKAGTLGVIIDEWILSFLFGVIRYVTPLLLLILAGFILKQDDYDYKPTHVFGAILFYLSFSSLIHLRFPAADMWRQALEGHGGGVFGMPAWILKTYVGTIGSIVILIGLLLVASLLLFHRLITYINEFYDQSMARMNTPREKQQVYKETQETPEEDEEEDEEFEEDEFEESEEEEDDYQFTKTPVTPDDEEEEDEEEPTSMPLVKKLPVPAAATMTAQDAVWARRPVIKPLPKLDLFSTKKSKPTSGDIKSNQKIIHDTLSEFRIEVDMGEVRVGPTVTQYSMKPAKGVKVSRITSLANDLSLALAAHPIRIEAPIPGQSLVGIEVPNEKTAIVSMREMFESTDYLRRKHDMMIALGKDVAGKVWFVDLPQMPHLLIAGATGSGKTVCMHTIILSLIYQNTAETLRMIMVDPKRVELSLYNGIPHLLAPVITNTKKTVHALNWTIGEMDRRFELLSKVGCRDITSYNETYSNDKLPYIVFFIDELADLMATAANEVEGGIIRIAQLARAVGIHLVVATQRPSVDVITGLMKANIPGRISFSVASFTDSRTVLDTGGAEKLLGRGDMLHLTASLSKPVRIQGAFISEKEVKSVVSYLKHGVRDAYDVDLFSGEKGNGGVFGGHGDDDNDALFSEAKQLVVETSKASASFLQRKLKIGYARAARILDELETAGIIGPSNGSKAREILITQEELTQEAAAIHEGSVHNVFTQEEEPEEEMEKLFDEDQEDEYDEGGDEEENDDELSEEEADLTDDKEEEEEENSDEEETEHLSDEFEEEEEEEKLSEDEATGAFYY
ncbi:MAG: DNA translocase FtsK [Candidatus Magasanikbacteria bacterium]|nr:DNA translocase FtsK [Candidatus Magasanikbacteria bacterium]